MVLVTYLASVLTLRNSSCSLAQDDRDSYKYEVNLLVQKMTELQKEKHELFVWAKEQQERHLQEIRKLTRALGRTRKAIDEQVSQPQCRECQYRSSTG